MSKRSKAIKNKTNRGQREWRRQWQLRQSRKYRRVGGGGASHSSQYTKWGLLNEHTKRNSKLVGDDCFEITLPPVLDFEENYEETVSHLRMIRSAGLKRIRLRNLHFDDLHHISPAAALVLASEVDQWNRAIQGKLRAKVETWNDQIYRLLSEMGYFELLDLSSSKKNLPQGSTTFLNFRRGDISLGDKGYIAKDLRERIETIVGTALSKHSLFQGLSEAITNVTQHAYPNPRDYAKDKPWWLSASYDKDSQQINIMFYDQGATIPGTLPSSKLFEGIKESFRIWSDSQKIQAAMKYGRTSTARQERGKGLKDMEYFAKAYDEGLLSIYSNRGLYRIIHPTDEPAKILRRDHKLPIGGTLIEWAVKLS